MGNALCSIDLSDIDVRAKPCVIDFIRTKMRKYAEDHKWDFQESDFEFVKQDQGVYHMLIYIAVFVHIHPSPLLFYTT